MTELIQYWPLVICVGGLIAGAVRVELWASETKRLSEQHEAEIAKLKEKLQQNETYDRLRDERIKILDAYKVASETSRDAALMKLTHIETLLMEWIKNTNRRIELLEKHMS